MNARTITFPTLTKEHPLERVLLRVLILSIIALVALYIYFIAASTFNIIARKQAETQSAAVQGILAQQSADYYALTSSLTKTRAQSLGLTALSDKEYVTRSIHLGYAD